MGVPLLRGVTGRETAVVRHRDLDRLLVGHLHLHRGLPKAPAVDRGCGIASTVDPQERNEHPAEIHGVEINLLMALEFLIGMTSKLFGMYTNLEELLTNMQSASSEESVTKVEIVEEDRILIN